MTLQTEPSTAGYRLPYTLVLAAACSWPGCPTLSRFQRNHVCPLPPVVSTLAARQQDPFSHGYLRQAPPLAATPLDPGETAVETAIRLREQIDQLQTENTQLQANVATLHATNEQNQESLHEAAEALRQADRDLTVLRQEMDQRLADFRLLQRKARQQREQHRNTLADVEDRLQALVTQHAAYTDEANAISPSEQR